MGRYHTDQATSDDLLRYDDFRAALYDVITQAETPLTVGVFGPWGSGKTSLMRMLRRKLEGEGLDSRRTVWFTAWKYDRQEALWRAFILRVLDALYPRETEPAGAPREERPILQQPGEREQRLVDLLQRLEESVYQAADWTEMGGRAINWWQFISNTTKAGVETAATLGTAGLFPQLKKMMGGDDTPVAEIQKAAAAIGRETKQYHRRQLFHMEQFEAMFREAVQLIDAGAAGRLVVFVDDLDRCLPEKAVEVLEAIKLFLEVPGAVFVLGRDQAVIRQGIEIRYGAMLRGAGGERLELPIRGDSYLQKIVQIPFHLPPLAVEDVTTFIEKLAADLSPRTQAVLARGLYPNPRQVKRVLNILRLLRGVADRRFPQDVIADPLLAKTVVIQTQYPELYQLWRQYPTLVQTLEMEMARRPVSEEDLFMGARRILPAPKGEEDAAAEEEGAAGSLGRGGLLATYLENRTENALLRRMMTYPPPDEVGEGRARARFSGLAREAVQAYVRLAGAVQNNETTPAVAVVVGLDAFLSGEAVQIQEAVSMLDSKEADSAGPKHQEARRQLVAVLQNPAQPTAARVSAGESLALLGDPRFRGAEGYCLPADEMLGFVEIPAGPFRMGSDPERDPQAREDEQPAHEVTLPTFYLARYPVTVAQFHLFAQQSGYELQDKDSLQGAANHPVSWITWYDVVAYCNWLDEVLRGWSGTPVGIRRVLANGYRVLLPSEAEWEKAARGGEGRIYPWGDALDPDCANSKESGLGRTSPVGCFPAGASLQGILDLSGNVWEWTRSLYQEYPYEPGADRGKWVAASADEFILKGGYWSSGLAFLRCGVRFRYLPLYGLNYGGFRVVLSPFTADR